MGLWTASMGANLHYPGRGGCQRHSVAILVRRRKAAEEMFGGRCHSHQGTTTRPARIGAKRDGCHGSNVSVSGNMSRKASSQKSEMFVM